MSLLTSTLLAVGASSAYDGRNPLNGAALVRQRRRFTGELHLRHPWQWARLSHVSSQQPDPGPVTARGDWTADTRNWWSGDDGPHVQTESALGGWRPATGDSASRMSELVGFPAAGPCRDRQRCALFVDARGGDLPLSGLLRRRPRRRHVHVLGEPDLRDGHGGCRLPQPLVRHPRSASRWRT